MPIAESVTLVIYGWRSVQPGTLSWVFPSVAAAAHAANTMTNAVEWAVIRGSRVRADRDASMSLAHLRVDAEVLLHAPVSLRGS